MSVIVSIKPAQAGRPTARRPRRTNREMVLQPLWAGYLRAIHRKLVGSSQHAAFFGCPAHRTIREADEMLTAFAIAVEERRYVAARRTKAERASYERVCLLLSQVEHSLRSVKLAQAEGTHCQATSDADSAALIDRAIAELPKLDQIAGVARYLGFAPCLGEMISTELWE